MAMATVKHHSQQHWAWIASLQGASDAGAAAPVGCSWGFEVTNDEGGNSIIGLWMILGYWTRYLDLIGYLTIIYSGIYLNTNSQLNQHRVFQCILTMNQW